MKAISTLLLVLSLLTQVTAAAWAMPALSAGSAAQHVVMAMPCEHSMADAAHADAAHAGHASVVSASATQSTPCACAEKHVHCGCMHGGTGVCVLPWVAQTAQDWRMPAALLRGDSIGALHAPYTDRLLRPPIRA